MAMPDALPPRRPTLVPHTPRARDTGSRVVRALLALVVGPILLGALIVMVLANTPWGNERIRQLIVSQGNKRLRGELAIGSLRGGLLSHATLTDVALVDSARHPVFTAKRVDVRYALLAAIRGRVVIRSVTLDTPLVVLDKQPGARWNFQQLMRPSGTPKDSAAAGTPPELANVTIHHGHLVYRRPWRPDCSGGIPP